MDANDKKNCFQFWCKSLSFFCVLYGTHGTCMRTTKFGDLEMLIFRCCFSSKLKLWWKIWHMQNNNNCKICVFPLEIWRKWNSDGHKQNQELQECLELLAFFFNTNVIGWWRAKIRSSNNADNYCRVLMIMMITLFVVPCHTSKYWSWRGPQQHFRMRHNGGHMSKWGGLRILILAGATATFCALINFRNPEFWVSLGANDKSCMRNLGGIGGKTWGTLTDIEIRS